MKEPNTNADETLARITQLVRQALQAQAEVAKQSIELGRATLSSEVDTTAAGRAWVEAVSREGARYWREVGALGIDVAGQLLTLGSRGLARVASDMREAARRSGQSQHRRGPTMPRGPVREGSPASDEDGPGIVVGEVVSSSEDVRRVSVTLHGPVGETATGAITLANQHARARRVILKPGGVRPESGRHVRLEVRVDPDAVTIPALGEHVVSIEVDLDPAVVESGERYVGVIEVTGGVEAVVDVAVEVA